MGHFEYDLNANCESLPEGFPKSWGGSPIFNPFSIGDFPSTKPSSEPGDSSVATKLWPKAMNHQYTALQREKKLGDDWQNDRTASGAMGITPECTRYGTGYQTPVVNFHDLHRLHSFLLKKSPG